MAIHSQDLSERARAFTLASIFCSYPGEELDEVLASIEPHPAAHGIAQAIAEHGGDDLRSAYLDLFDRGKDRASLHETEYGHMRGMAKGNDLADIAGFYAAFGVEIASDEVHETPDHVAVELEFYGLLLLKQRLLEEAGDAEGCAIVEDARKAFLKDHLGRLTRAIAERSDVREHPTYGPALVWCHELVANECAALGVEPPPLDFFDDDDQRRHMDCGHVRLPVIQ